MDWLASVAKTIAAQKIPLLLSSLLPSLAIGLLYLRTEIAPHLSDPTGWLALRAIALSIALFPLPLAAYFYFRPKYKFMPDLGVNKNLKTGQYFCSPCYVQHKIESPLKTEPHGWFCDVCRKEWDDPSRPRPQLTPQENSWPL